MPRLKKVLESHNNKLHVKKDDTVIVITGKDKGKKGRVIAAYPRENRVLVEGVNMVKKHASPSQANPQGGIIEQEAPIHVSNVMHIDPKSGKVNSHRIQSARQRQKSSDREKIRRSDRLIEPRRKGGHMIHGSKNERSFSERNYSCSDAEIQLHNGHASAESRKGRYQHGCW